MIKSNLKNKIEKYKKLDIIENLNKIQEVATIHAINETTKNTPPTSSNYGTNTVTGELKSSWARDSIKTSKNEGNKYITILASKCYYASFVNYGHILDKHFVPGLVVNPYSNKLEKVPYGQGGIVVGTKTHYVTGYYMLESGINEYQKRIRYLLDNFVKELSE